MANPFTSETPWDAKVLGRYTAEINTYTEEAILECLKHPGLYTLKLDSLDNKALVNKYGFYYCDTLLKPVCKRNALVSLKNPSTFVRPTEQKAALLEICASAFSHGRFHKDPCIAKQLADARYVHWLSELIDNEKVFSLFYENEIAGFIATKNNQLLLHAVAEKFRGQGLAKFWWSAVCHTLLQQGFETIESSISASNLAVVNLYASLGFRIEKSTDIYHKVVD